jgi:Fungal Zn(2)-Cys(6) binuclear cluster domain
MQEPLPSSAKIASSASISSVSSLLNSWPIASSTLETSAPSLQKYPSGGDRFSGFQASNHHEPPSESVQKGAIDLLAAASRESANGEAGPRRAGQPRMRSSIACARCRRSKIKCLNSGVNTTCRACQVSGRECTYPAPVLGDRSNRRESSVIRTPGEAGASATDVRRTLSASLCHGPGLLTSPSPQNSLARGQRKGPSFTMVLPHRRACAPWWTLSIPLY